MNSLVFVTFQNTGIAKFCMNLLSQRQSTPRVSAEYWNSSMAYVWQLVWDANKLIAAAGVPTLACEGPLHCYHNVWGVFPTDRTHARPKQASSRIDGTDGIKTFAAALKFHVLVNKWRSQGYCSLLAKLSRFEISWDHMFQSEFKCRSLNVFLLQATVLLMGSLKNIPLASSTPYM